MSPLQWKWIEWENETVMKQPAPRSPLGESNQITEGVCFCRLYIKIYFYIKYFPIKNSAVGLNCHHKECNFLKRPFPWTNYGLSRTPEEEMLWEPGAILSTSLKLYTGFTGPNKTLSTKHSWIPPMSGKQTVSTPWRWCWHISTELGLTLNWLKGGRIETSVTLRHVSELPGVSWIRDPQGGKGSPEGVGTGAVIWEMAPLQSTTVPLCGCVWLPGPRPLPRCPDPKARVQVMRIKSEIGCYSYAAVPLWGECVLWIGFLPRRWTWPNSYT